MATMFSMPEFIAHCLEEIGLEGRCGLPIRDLFCIVDPDHDVAYQNYAWNVLRDMAGNQLQFYQMVRTESINEVIPAKENAKSKRKGGALGKKTKGNSKVGSSLSTTVSSNTTLPPSRRIGSEKSRPTRKKWVTTLMPVDEGMDGRKPTDGSSRKRSRGMSMIDEENQSKEQQDIPPKSKRNRSIVSQAVHYENGRSSSRTPNPLARAKPSTDPSLLLNSPRGYTRSVEIDVSNMAYDDVIAMTEDSLVGVVACEMLRFKSLGVADIELNSPQAFDLLEAIGRTREVGLNAAIVSSGGLFGDGKKIHYLMDLLLANKLVVKNIVIDNHRRFNIIHLPRFVQYFHPSMISSTAYLEKDLLPKEQMPWVIFQLVYMRTAGKNIGRSCVFSEIGRDLGIHKRHQEILRNYILGLMQTDPAFPLELFMARCTSKRGEVGRKLWCIRIKPNALRTSDRDEFSCDTAVSEEGPIIECGLMNQVYNVLVANGSAGATIPEMRDILGVPSFKLPYKLAQTLITNYQLRVEQIVQGKSTMYRMFTPDSSSVVTVAEESDRTINMEDLVTGPDTVTTDEIRVESDVETKMETPVKTPVHGAPLEKNMQENEASRESLRSCVVLSASIFERRRQNVKDWILKYNVMAISEVRMLLAEVENEQNQRDVKKTIDYRSIRRLLEELEADRVLVTLDITLPPRKALKTTAKVVKAIAVPGMENDREQIRAFVDRFYTRQRDMRLSRVPEEIGSMIVSDGNHVQEDVTSEIVPYKSDFHLKSRAQYHAVHKQSRRLGLFHGVLYRCLTFHSLMWKYLPTLESSQHTSSNDILFKLKEFLNVIKIREYMHLIHVKTELSETEEDHVRAAIAQGDTWHVLTPELQSKLRHGEIERFSDLLEVLFELKLLDVTEESSREILLRNLEGTHEFDQVLSQTAFTTLSSGLLRLKSHVRIPLVHKDSDEKELCIQVPYVCINPHALSSARVPSEQFMGQIPLEFDLQDESDAFKYWQAIKFISLEGAQLPIQCTNETSESLSVNSRVERVRTAPLRKFNISTMIAWIPRATSVRTVPDLRSDAIACVNELATASSTKRKRNSNPQASLGRSSKVARKEYDELVASVYANDVVGNQTQNITASRWREQDEWGGAKSTIRASNWSPEEDITLIDLYIERLTRQWFIEVPVALQRFDERVAFRTTSLSRTNIVWNSIAKQLKRTIGDTKLRVRELLRVPAILARVEHTKKAVTKVKNPSDQFEEELAVHNQPRLTALRCRAMQITLHDRLRYHSGLADILISHWKEPEVRFVWRYLWLASIITRTKVIQGKDSTQRERGFCLHSNMFETASLKYPQFTLDFYGQVAKQRSFIQQNLTELDMCNVDNNDGDSLDGFTKQTIPANMATSRIALDLTSIVTDEVVYTPEFSAPERTSETSTFTLKDARRNSAFKGYGGHLSTIYGCDHPDIFLRDVWSVTALYKMNTEQDKHQEAFSTQSMWFPQTNAVSNGSNVTTQGLKEWLVEVIDQSGRDGLTMSDLVHLYQTSTHQESLDDALNDVLEEALVLEVNGDDSVRFISSKHSDIWVVYPYNVFHDHSQKKLRFEFSRDHTIIARPWLHFDGSVNTQMLLMLKSRVINFVMGYPGIHDRALHKKLHKMLSLQDVRTLCEELIDEEILYCRIGRHHIPQSTLFRVNKGNPTDYSLTTFTPGQGRYINNSTDRLHYFTSVRCIELFGAAANDQELAC